LARYLASIPAVTGLRSSGAPVTFAGGRCGFDDLLGVLGLNVLTGDRGADRGGEPLAQPGLGIGVPA
jgi:hypothetical protein